MYIIDPFINSIYLKKDLCDSVNVAMANNSITPWFIMHHIVLSKQNGTVSWKSIQELIVSCNSIAREPKIKQNQLLHTNHFFENVSKRYRKPKGKSRMENPETWETLDTDTERRQKKPKPTKWKDWATRVIRSFETKNRQYNEQILSSLI